MAIHWDSDHGTAYEIEPSPRWQPDWPVWLYWAACGALGIEFGVASWFPLMLFMLAWTWVYHQRNTLRAELAQERQASHAFEQTATTLMQRERR